jgi:ESF2/ABP1 family protein
MSKPQPKKHQSANFTEAWLEFLDKRIAKTVAPMLNAQLIGGKKGDRWRDDIWTMRYLSGFKWEMLGEQVGKSKLERACSAYVLVPALIPMKFRLTAYERQAHQARLRQSLSQSKTEQADYLRNVELARVLNKRRAKKAEQGPDETSQPAKKLKKEPSASVATSSGEVGSEQAKRKYKQRDVANSAQGGGASRDKAGGGGASSSTALQGVLNGLF